MILFLDLNIPDEYFYMFASVQRKMQKDIPQTANIDYIEGLGLFLESIISIIYGLLQKACCLCNYKNI